MTDPQSTPPPPTPPSPTPPPPTPPPQASPAPDVAWQRPADVPAPDTAWPQPGATPAADGSATSPAYPPPAYPTTAYPTTAYPTTAYPTTAYPGGAVPAQQPSYPAAAPGYGSYAGYGAQPAYPAYAPAPKANGLAIASMVTSIVGAMLLFCYGLGALPGIAGAVMGHIARRQIRERGDGGDGMALAGIIVGWIATALGLVIIAIVVAVFANLITDVNSYNYDY